MIRFIPACAGNTSPRAVINPEIAVHPRVCGEHYVASLASSQTTGSSPRVRGTLTASSLGVVRVRFIPACAGNTQVHRVGWDGLTVHPRVCGEHPFGAPWYLPHHGSSPRVRGTLKQSPPGHTRQRFIPACAGNTAPFGQRLILEQVHPRVCGEHVPASRDKARVRGSSPRVRGTLIGQRLISSFGRFIPACAGNTLQVPTQPGLQAVHPRVCGEHADHGRRFVIRHGSSPRVRGTLPVQGLRGR